MKRLFQFSLLIGSVCVLFSCNSSTRFSHPPIHNGNVIIAYTDSGTADTTLLFVHGWCINKSYWANQAAYFNKKYRVVTMDLPGFGTSGKNRSDWSTSAYSHDVDSVITGLGLKNVIVVGHSMAGDIVLQSALDNAGTVIAVVGVDNFKTTFQPESPEAKQQFASVMEMLKHNFHAVASEYVSKYLFSSTTSVGIKQRVLNDVAHADTTIAAAALSQTDDFDEGAKLRELKVKLYLINSDYTPTDTTGLVKNNIAYKLLTIHGTGHFPMIEDVKGFNLQMENMLAGVSKKKN